ncbi:hypothetical protein [Parasphingorhabdus sp.]|uniref:hypothetical protein n=1 Tax=Parasphingorhabdus sp. TaxID=2709688 RepID=UPI003A944153
MIVPIFFILLIVLLVALPAIAGWKLSRNHGQFARMAGTILAGQMILTPGIIFISISKATVAGENPVRTMIIYAGMALVISIMTFAVLEIKNTPKRK